MISVNNITNSFNTQSISSDKQNYHQNFTQNVTHAKQFSHNFIETKDSRHFTLTQRKPFSQTRKNKTAIGLQSQKLKSSNHQLSDIYIQTVKNNDFQKQNTSNQPLRIIINQKETSNFENKDLKQQKDKIVSQKKNSTENKSTEFKEKKQPYIKKQNKHKQSETHSTLHNHKLQESDLRLHIPHKKQFSEATQQHEFPLQQIFVSCSHVMKPIKNNYTINHVFNRHLSCALSQPVTFHLPTKSDQALHSQKISRFFYSQFKIFLNKRGQQFQLGTLKSNFTGSVYNFYPKDVNQIYFSIIFSSKKSDCSHEFRYCQIYINNELYSPKSKQSRIIPFNKMQSLEGLYILNSQQSQSLNSIIRLKSKLPTWSLQHQCYSMNFGTKSILPSVKNTIIVDDNEKQVMKFYKNSHLTYEMSFQNPFSWVLAYGYALASTDFKISTQ